MTHSVPKGMRLIFFAFLISIFFKAENVYNDIANKNNNLTADAMNSEMAKEDVNKDVTQNTLNKIESFDSLLEKKLQVQTPESDSRNIENLNSISSPTNNQTNNEEISKIRKIKEQFEQGKDLSLDRGLLDILMEEVNRFLEKEDKLKKRDSDLSILEKKVRDEHARLVQLRNESNEIIKKANLYKSENQRKIIDIYENMKPRDAAKIFNELDPFVASEFLKNMQKEKSSLILSYMNTKKAQMITGYMINSIK